MLAARGARLPRRSGASARATARSSSPTTTTPTAPRIALKRGGPRGAGGARRPRRGARARCREAARALGIRVARGPRHRRASRAAARVTGVEVCAQAGEGAALRDDRLRRGRDVGRLVAGRAPLVALRRQARLGRGAGAFRPRPGAAAARPRRRGLRARRRGGRRRARRRGRPRDGASAPGAGRPRSWASRPATRPRPAGGGRRRRRRSSRSGSMPQGAGAGAAREGVPRLPERREGLRRASSRRRRAMPASSTPSATPRSAWRPTRASSPTSTASPCSPTRWRPADPGGRHHDLPPALHAGHLRRARRRGARAALQADAPDADRRLARRQRRALGAGRRLAAALLLPPPRRERRGGGHPRDPRTPASGVGLLDASTLGKILVKGPDAGRFLDLALHRRHVVACRSAAAATG